MYISMSVTMILMASMCLLLEALCPSVCSVCLLFYFMKTKLDKKKDLTFYLVCIFLQTR